MKNAGKLILIMGILACVATGCSPKDTPTMQQAGSALEVGDYDSALALYNAAIEEGKQLQACYRGKGIALMGKMEYESAAQAFETALTSETFMEKNVYRDGMKDDINRFLASCYTRCGNGKSAVEIYDGLIEKDAEDPLLYMDRATAMAQMGMIDEAKADFDKAINLDRGNYERILEIAQILDSVGEKEIGIAYLADVPGMTSAEIDQVLQGRILYFMEEYQGAVDLLSNYRGADEEAVLILCRSYIALDNTKAATEVIEQYGDIAQSSPTLLGLLGSIRMKQEKYDEAAEAFEQGLRAAQAGTDEMRTLMYNRAVAYEYMGDFEKAKELFTSYLEQYSGDEDARHELEFLRTR